MRPRSKLVDSLKAKARALGFDACRVAAAEPAPHARERLAAWLGEGAHGDMAWMAETFERRADPRALMAGAKSLLLLGLNYGPDGDPLAALARRDCGAISVYARNRDYHAVVKGRLKALASHLAAAARPEAADVKVFVDTAPLMEKPLAARAGIGWQGKHTNLVSREFGSWLFLGAILTDLELPPDEPETDHCGTCRACLDACPTDAFPAPYRLDARRCISYLTIELKGPIPRPLRAAIGNRIYGCDDCLAACPWNKFAAAGREAKLAARDDLAAPPLAELARLDDPGFRARFAGSPIRRIGRARFCATSSSPSATRVIPRSPPRRGSGSTTQSRSCAAPPSGRSRKCCQRRNFPPWPACGGERVRRRRGAGMALRHPRVRPVIAPSAPSRL